MNSKLPGSTNSPGSPNSAAPNPSPQKVPAGSEAALLPETGISEILGFVELLKAKGGREDIYKLAQELSMEFGETLTVIRGAELLHLVHTPGGDVVLEPLGEKISKARINERKDLIKKQVMALPVFNTIHRFLREKEGREATRDEIQEKLAELIPNENAENSFVNLVSWGRYAEIFGYNDDTNTFYLDEDKDDREDLNDSGEKDKAFG